MGQVNHAEVRARMLMNGITQYEVSNLMGLKSHSTLNQWLNGMREVPDEFERKAAAAVELLLKANAAAQQARDRVLAEAKSGL